VIGIHSVKPWENIKNHQLNGYKERLKNKLPLYPCSFAATLPIFLVTMPHIAPQKIVDWLQNSGG
jgi:hypothetical protein